MPNMKAISIGVLFDCRDSISFYVLKTDQSRLLPAKYNTAIYRAFLYLFFVWCHADIYHYRKKEKERARIAGIRYTASLAGRGLTSPSAWLTTSGKGPIQARLCRRYHPLRYSTPQRWFHPPFISRQNCRYLLEDVPWRTFCIESCSHL